MDVDAGRVLVDQSIVIRDGKIVSVNSSAGFAIPAGATVIDLSHMTVLPGLIDCHTHLVGDAADTDPVSELRKTSAVRAFESIPNAKVTLLAGFTTVRDVGTYRALVDVALRDAIARGDVIGPRMFVAGAYITITGGGGSLNGVAPDITLPWDLRFGVADGPEEVRQRVRALEANNVDLIKVIATGAFLSHGSVPTTNDFTYDEIRAAVEEAGKKGLRVAAHAHGATGIKDAVRAGVASIEHGTMIDDEGLRMMKEHGTYLVADIYDDDCISTGLNGEPGDFQAKESVYGELQRQNFKKAVQTWRKDRVRDGCFGLSAWHECETVRVPGEVWANADAGDSVGDHKRGDADWQAGRVRLDCRWEIGGYYCGEWRSLCGYSHARARFVRDERRKSL